MKQNSDQKLFGKAIRAMRKAVKNVIEKRKHYGHPLIVLQDGKIVKIPAKKLGRL